ncbi:VF530 family protein [Ancylomarina sp. YFZ004]
MDIKNNQKIESTDKQKQSDELSVTEFKPKTNEMLNEAKPARRNRRQATEEELNNPLHGVKLVVVLERLVEHYGWEYLGERVNIRCFKYNPTMKSSLGFLRRTTWAREHVEDIYLEMLKRKRFGNIT